VFKWANGEKYDGEWKRGNQHGEGAFTDKDGVTRNGLYDDGKIIKWYN
jgi:hypothetical protein